MENLVESLYRAHFAEMLLLASRKLIRREDAPDIVHDVFLLAWQREALLAAHENPGGWLFRTLQFRILRENALAHHHRELLSPAPDFVPPEGASSALLELLPASLSPEEARILCLYFDEGYSHGTIGQILGIPAYLSRKRLSRAVEKCRLALL